MENTDVPIEQQTTTEETKTVEETVTAETTTETVEETPTTTTEPETVGETEMAVTKETEIVAEPVKETEIIEDKPVVEETTKTEEVVRETVGTENEETGKSTIDEQENVTTTNGVAPTALSPGRVNVPLKEVNESEKEETNIIANPTETTISKKRELEQEEPRNEENGTDSDERTGDQTKKLKTADTVDAAIMEPKEVELNPVANGAAGIEA